MSIWYCDKCKKTFGPTLGCPTCGNAGSRCEFQPLGKTGIQLGVFNDPRGERAGGVVPKIGSRVKLACGEVVTVVAETEKGFTYRDSSSVLSIPRLGVQGNGTGEYFAKTHPGATWSYGEVPMTVSIEPDWQKLARDLADALRQAADTMRGCVTDIQDGDFPHRFCAGNRCRMGAEEARNALKAYDAIRESGDGAGRGKA